MFKKIKKKVENKQNVIQDKHYDIMYMLFGNSCVTFLVFIDFVKNVKKYIYVILITLLIYLPEILYFNNIIQSIPDIYHLIVLFYTIFLLFLIPLMYDDNSNSCNTYYNDYDYYKYDKIYEHKIHTKSYSFNNKLSKKQLIKRKINIREKLKQKNIINKYNEVCNM